MQEKEKELMERYIYEVIRKVPSGQREEIRMELMELIGDMYEAENGSMEAVLIKLGNPKEFAKKYRNESGYLIGPQYFDNYVWILKIVLLCALGSGLLSSVISIVTGQPDTFFDHLFDAVFGVFGIVTVVFAVMERMEVKADFKEKQAWSLEQLHPVPDKKGRISRGESIVSIVFLTILMAFIMFAPHLLGAYVIEDGKLLRTIPLFNLEKWNELMPFMLILFFLCLIDAIIRLIIGCYCNAVMISNIIVNGLTVVLSAFMFTVLPVWNPDFVTDIEAAFDFNINSKTDLLFYWGENMISNVVILVIVLVALGEVCHTVYKTVRFGRR